MYDWDFDVIWQYRTVFIKGAWVTLQITFFSVIIGTLLGIILGLGRASKKRWISIPVALYIEVFLALPVLVLLIWIYYCGPMFGLKLSGLLTAVFALSLSLSAFVAEIVRSGVLTVPPGHIEAARALGMNKWQALYRIVMPQTLRIIFPPLLSMYISTIKLSSLASVIAVYELLHSAQNLIMNTFRPLEIYTTVAVIYIIIVLPFVVLSRRLENSAKSWRLS